MKHANGVRLYTKSGIDWTAKYKLIAAEASKLKANSFIIEGEVIVTNEAGLSDFHALRSAITRRPKISTWLRSIFCTLTATTCEI
jgi:ATP-dependent DNA ligase